MKRVFFFFFLLISFPVLLWAQTPDSGIIKNDSTIKSITQNSTTGSSLNNLLQENKLLNSSGKPVSMVEKIKVRNSKEIFFYLIILLVLFLAIFRFFYARYFTDLFRIFFNTSLQQSQLTEQLMQSKFSSLLFNIFFIISGGMFIYFLLLNYQWINEEYRITSMAICISVLAIIYMLKFSLLKFTGWLTGYTTETNTYIFIFFLINKIIGIMVVPVIVIMVFSDKIIVDYAVIISLIAIGLLVLSRFFRSYGILQNQLRISRFHFFLYIIGIEILPLLLIYKGLVVLLNKNL